MATEDVDPRFTDLDAWPFPSAIEAMWDGQMAAVAAVRPALPLIAAAAEAGAEQLRSGGRIVYVGAGTSGRVAVQDGTELPPTFDWPRERLIYVLAGGDKAMLASVEGAEDDAVDAVHRMEAAHIAANDVVIGVAASGTTPFTVAALDFATRAGALTIGISNNAGAPLLAAARHPLLVETGSELIAGSTRMKAGTTQKIVLNLISTGMMLRLGKVYRGMMVNMHASNLKLRKRASQMVARIAGCDVDEAAKALEEADWDIKSATLLVLGFGKGDAQALLERAGGNLRNALADAAVEGS